MTQSTISKAVFPVGGLGTRFLPATKAIAKEMLPIVDKPLIQYAVEEAMEAGCTNMIFITGRTKRSIEDHFDAAVELENELEIKQKTELLEIIRNIIPSYVSCSFIRQSHPRGLGHAVLCARPIVGNDPFMVVLSDDMIDSETGCLKQMIDVQRQTGGNMIAVDEVPMENITAYGVVDVDNTESNPMRLQHIIEKPSQTQAPSNLAVIGRYILQPGIFPILEKIRPSIGSEIQLTDAIEILARQQAVHAFRFDGTRYDCGSKLGFLKAMVKYAMKHPDLAGDFKKYLKSTVGAADETKKAT